MSDFEDIPARPRLKKLRLLAILIPLALLAVVSTVFGMMMAVASDLPSLENEKQYNGPTPKNSILEDAQGQTIGRLASNQNRIYVKYEEIASTMRAAVISVEDERFQTNSGVDLRGIARAFVQDIIQGGAVQGGSTITQQFVKNAMQAQNKRTVFQKLRESALAYHLTHKWGKKKILQEYLNSVYFGNGAYGIEAAAETYFKVDHPGCGTEKKPCAGELTPWESALLAGIIASPSRFDPVAHPVAARHRRDIVLKKMLEQRYITRSVYDEGRAQALPAPVDVNPPSLDVKVPYFVSWIRQRLVDKLGAQRAFEGGLRIRTTIDLKLQAAAENAVKAWLPPGAGPTASLVAIDNDTGQVRAMVSGTQDYKEAPFNLATQGQRQPGSAFKPFILAEALKRGYGPGSIWPSRKRSFCVVKRGKKCIEAFVVNNFEDTYVGARSLANALTWSDNSVFATAGIKVGTKRVARLAERMGIRTPVSSNMAMTLGGLKEGVTPLDMAHAYETIATGGKRVYGTLGSGEEGPVGIISIKQGKKTVYENKTRWRRVLSPNVAETTKQIMSTVVSQGTGKRAAFGEFAAGKTGTTENYGDAWFVGFTDRMTVAVWVGYPEKLIPMKTDFAGAPVEGGTFPALIWNTFMRTATPILDAYREADKPEDEEGDEGTPVDPTVTAPVTTTTTTEAPAEGGVAGEGGTENNGDREATETPEPATPPPPPQPAPAPVAPPPAAGTGEGGTGGVEPDTGGAAPG
ncbi:MAG TPA: transglycosylase domain-containing protein [Solirubrobacteraceae bacterium]